MLIGTPVRFSTPESFHGYFLEKQPTPGPKVLLLGLMLAWAAEARARLLEIRRKARRERVMEHGCDLSYFRVKNGLGVVPVGLMQPGIVVW